MHESHKDLHTNLDRRQTQSSARTHPQQTLSHLSYHSTPQSSQNPPRNFRFHHNHPRRLRRLHRPNPHDPPTTTHNNTPRLPRLHTPKRLHQNPPPDLPLPPRKHMLRIRPTKARLRTRARLDRHSRIHLTHTNAIPRTNHRRHPRHGRRHRRRETLRHRPRRRARHPTARHRLPHRQRRHARRDVRAREHGRGFGGVGHALPAVAGVCGGEVGGGRGDEAVGFGDGGGVDDVGRDEEAGGGGGAAGARGGERGGGCVGAEGGGRERVGGWAVGFVVGGQEGGAVGLGDGGAGGEDCRGAVADGDGAEEGGDDKAAVVAGEGGAALDVEDGGDGGFVEEGC